VSADAAGRWHAKDHLAHLAWWRHRSAHLIQLARTGGAPPPRAPDDDTQNAIIYAETKDRPVADVKRDAADSWAELESALEASSESDLTKPHVEYPESQVWEAVPGLAGHLGSHMMSWFMDKGDVERAEAAARWGYEMECSFLPEGPKRAEASYNLACFFARAGRVDEALPLLRYGLRFQPSLVEWARKDPDLAGIRDRAEVRELLATS
jgi:DinB family protein